MKFAVIGLGSFGTKRAQSIKKSKLANLVAIHDTNHENAQKASELLNVPIFKYDQILKDGWDSEKKGDFSLYTDLILLKN